jgi:hypothetical protein
MWKCDFFHCTAWSRDHLSIGATSTVVILVPAYVYCRHGNCV